MSKQPKQKGPKFNLEFKQDAVRLVLEKGYTQQQAAASLGVSLSAIGRWVRAERNPASGSVEMKSVLNLTDQTELIRLRQENEQLRMEREILKNCLHRNPLAHLSRNTVSSYTLLIWKVVERLLEILIPSKNLTQGVSGPSVGGQSDPV